jgi:hypothetical protein
VAAGLPVEVADEIVGADIQDMPLPPLGIDHVSGGRPESQRCRLGPNGFVQAPMMPPTVVSIPPKFADLAVDCRVDDKLLATPWTREFITEWVVGHGVAKVGGVVVVMPLTATIPPEFVDVAIRAAAHFSLVEDMLRALLVERVAKRPEVRGVGRLYRASGCVGNQVVVMPRMVAAKRSIRPEFVDVAIPRAVAVSSLVDDMLRALLCALLLECVARHTVVRQWRVSGCGLAVVQVIPRLPAHRHSP